MTDPETARAGERTLLALMAQAHASGADVVTLHALAEEASEAGARRALTQLGLIDGGAGRDIAELRQVLDAWRDARRTLRSALLNWVTRVLVAGLLIGLAAKLKLIGVKLPGV